MEKDKAVSIKTYTVTVEQTESGEITMRRKNDGFYPLELIGIAELIALEVRQQIMGHICIGQTAFVDVCCWVKIPI